VKPKENLQSRALQWLHEQPADSQLDEMTKLSLVFPDGPHRSDDDLKLDIIVADTEVLEMTEGLGDPLDAYNRKIKKALNDRINKLSPGPSPSEIVASPEKLLGVFGGNEPDIYLGRPGGAPAVLFSPPLATLQQRLDDLEQVEVSRLEVVDLAGPYFHCAVKFYRNEEAREDSIKKFINSAIGRTGDWGRFIDCAASKIKPDGCWWHDEFIIMFLELKNSLGLGGDALYQGIIDFSKILSRDKYKPFREHCNFPIVLVGISGNRLEISVAVCVGPIYVTKLLILDLSLGFHASDNIIHLARIFGALSRCREDLESYYKGVTTSAYPKLSCLFPNPTPVDTSNALPKLTYRQFLSRAGQPTSTLVDLNATTAMYIAVLDDTSEDVIVKFTAHYNDAAQRLLAEAGLAPKLHFCGRVVGGLYMIVMERVDGTSVWQLQQDNSVIPAIVATKVEEAVRLLHSEDIVFGDLRTNNIIYVASQDRVVLVDFDWPGKDREARYPVTLNPHEAGKSWQEDVSPYGIMRKAHDLWQLDRLKDLCLNPVFS